MSAAQQREEVSN